MCTGAGMLRAAHPQEDFEMAAKAMKKDNKANEPHQEALHRLHLESKQRLQLPSAVDPLSSYHMIGILTASYI